VGVLFTTSTSLAAAAPSVVVITHPKDAAAKRAAQYLSYGFRESIKSDSRFALQSTGLVFGDRALDISKLEQDAEVLIKEGQTAYDNLETDVATKKFEQALQKYEDALGELDSYKGAAKVALLAAAAPLLSNNDKQGRALIQKALLYDPNCAPDPRIFNSGMMNVFKDVKQKSRKGLTGSLSVTSNPTYAELYIDGDFVGLTPDKIDRISVGPHLVRLVRDGFRPLVQVVDVKGGKGDVPYTLNLIALPEQASLESKLAEASNEVTETSSSLIGSFAARANAQFVVFVSTQVSGDQVKMVSGMFTANGKRVGNVDKTFSSATDGFREEARNTWLALSPQALAVGTTVVANETVDSSFPTKAVVSWGLIGLGVAGIATGVVFGVLALGDTNNFKRNFAQTDPNVPQAQALIKSRALTADIMFGVGGAMVVAGVLCLILWDDSGSSRDMVSVGPVDLNFYAGPLGAQVTAGGTF
jgi:tetratricopeptide (TPR) repeat protein